MTNSDKSSSMALAVSLLAHGSLLLGVYGYRRTHPEAGLSPWVDRPDQQVDEPLNRPVDPPPPLHLPPPLPSETPFGEIGGKGDSSPASEEGVQPQLARLADQEQPDLALNPGNPAMGDVSAPQAASAAQSSSSAAKSSADSANANASHGNKGHDPQDQMQEAMPPGALAQSTFARPYPDVDTDASAPPTLIAHKPPISLALAPTPPTPPTPNQPPPDKTAIPDDAAKASKSKPAAPPADAVQAAVASAAPGDRTSSPPAPPATAAPPTPPSPPSPAAPPSPPSPAQASGGDQAPPSDRDSDAFSHIQVSMTRDGAVTARNGRPVITEKPRIGDGGLADLYALGMPRLTFKVSFDAAGKVTNVDQLTPTGHASIDTPIVRALYNWKFPPIPGVPPKADVAFITFEWVD